MFKYRALLSQNFIRDTQFAKRLIYLPEVTINKGEYVIEVGPGTGKLTTHILKRVGKNGHVKALEIDPSLAMLLKKRFAVNQNLEILNRNALEFDWNNLRVDYKVFSNLPFAISSSFLNLILNYNNGPKEAYILLQKEAASIFAGKRVNRGYETQKSLMAYPFFDFKILKSIAPYEFKPKPKVGIVLLKITKRQKPLIDPKSEDIYKLFIKQISRDRVGEGVWRKLFSKKELEKIRKTEGLVWRRGINSQNAEVMCKLFH